MNIVKSAFAAALLITGSAVTASATQREEAPIAAAKLQSSESADQTRARFAGYRFENGRYYRAPLSFDRGTRCWSETHPDHGRVKVCGAR